ncbi:CHRD domain-containing protein [Segetibacter aerophilus]|uniref:CHRD domain-containing protein n=1 Tax=Segetibacter aerophilus TaxID=670293 RepID=A0A512BAG5_9BACT|nr:CHRD domain-containing protein [Segetibacter aerophilus]GEO08939.1 hypothetical protein SAE01_14350 [Segetibacter aerophilus]
MKIKLYTSIYILACLAIATSCNKRNDYNGNVEVIKEWNFTLSSFNENYATPAIETSATFHMVALADNSIRYDVKIDSADRIVAARINLGDPLTEGSLLIDLPVRIYSTYASGVLPGLRAGLMDTLLNNDIEKYINITSNKAPLGLVRGQLNSELVLSKNVSLSGSAVVPSVTTTTAGTAFLRLTANNVLYSKIVLTNNDPSDPVTMATINQGGSAANGPAIVTLASTPQDIGVAKKASVNSSVSTALLNGNTYVTLSSALKPVGKLRGQIK